MTARAPRFSPAWRTFVLVAVVAVGAAAVAYVPERLETRVRTVGDASLVPEGAVAAPSDAEESGGGTTERVVVVADGTAGGAVGGQSGGVAGPGGGPGADPTAGPSGPLRCEPGKNGGSTDVGVTAKTIKLGATVVDSGVGASFLRDARYGILAVKNKVNQRGGICGRKLEVTLVDDGWDAGLGATYLRNLVEDEKVFALSVVPSSEGLAQASEAGYLRSKGVPVVGSDGMLKSQYTDPFIWPVAASTVTTMHVIADYAWSKEKRTFGIVYDNDYKFGQEGAAAFKNSLERLGGSIGNDCNSRFCGIQADAADYATQIAAFNSACSNCDYIVFLLQPTTAVTWIKQGGKVLPNGNTAGPQPLFTRKFAEECKQECHGMWLWTGYIPAIDANIGRPAVAEFRDDIKKTSSSADVTNTFVEGAYVGMKLLVAALERVGPGLTREALMTVLDNMTFDPGLTAKPLSWSKGNHFANVWMQAYSIQYTDRFGGWRDEQVSRKDPWIGEDI